MNQDKARERALALARLAARSSTPRHEAEAAGVALARLVVEHELLGKVRSELRQVVRVKGPFALIAETETAYRFAHLERAWISWVDKKHVTLVEWSTDEARRRSWGRVADGIEVTAEWAAHRSGSAD